MKPLCSTTQPMKKSVPITEHANKGPALLDITGQVCPLTFVHTRLRLERMGPGEVLEILSLIHI